MEDLSLSKQSGFDYDFVYSLDVKYECAICLNAMRKPMQTLCGHRFCKDCIISSIHGCSAECPIDKRPLDEKGLFHDSCVEREILQLKVKCLNHTLGCKCQTELQYIDDHMNACSYQPIICPNECSVTVLQRELEDHLARNCLHRIARCEHCCQPYPLQDEQHHFVVCPEIEISCDLCGGAMPRSKIAEHKNKICPHSQISCSFADHGCQTRVARKYLEKHLNTNVSSHLQLISSTYKKMNTFVQDMHRNLGTLTRQPSFRSQLSSNCEFYSSFIYPERSTLVAGAIGGNASCSESFSNDGLTSALNTELRDTQQALIDVNISKKGDKEEQKSSDPIPLDQIVRDLSSRNVDIDQRVLEEMIKVDSLVKRVNSLENIFRSMAYDSNGRFCNGSFVWRVAYFTETNFPLMEKGQVLHSPPFYSSQFGYCFCLRTNLIRTDGKDVLSLYIHMMQSNNDAFLDWPFKGRIILSILDCSESEVKHHITETMNILHPKKAFSKPNLPRSAKGYGYKEFIAVEQILKPTTGTYLKSDTVHIKAVIMADAK